MLPASYQWLDAVSPQPRMIAEALKLFGVHEGVGSLDNQEILGWAKEVGVEATYTHDAIPWCGLFLAVVAKRAGHPGPASPLWALNWAVWGEPAGQPCLGDVLVFVRPGGGHVGIYVGEDHAAYHVLGGNETDQVEISRELKIRLRAARQPAWAVGPPSTRKPYLLAPLGVLTTNEA